MPENDAAVAAAPPQKKVKKQTSDKPLAERIADSDKNDSVGNPKDGSLVGPRGHNAPLDVKPRPKEKPATSDVTAHKDSAGNEHPRPQLGPRGPHAAQIIRDSFHVDKHRS